jgi:hypothetical protein
MIVSRFKKTFDSILSFDNKVFKRAGIPDISLPSKKETETKKQTPPNQPTILKFFK